ncbi:helix-turn-helix domain-containing protein [Alkalihalobacterium alkalinitrilicum]|uniref:helix-turn-helix domain-containing protein n=1 Tax=Alkalihalobacterium alkalinitrilicum TaxID=427920 RepID=UPI000995191C|nr:helix-turn-helix domain-containing protein [Alkalihalobacterium alkalinitrilicum]
MAEILIVDDLESRQSVEAILVDSHYDYFTINAVETATKGMHLLRQKQPTILLLDLSLPDEDGLEFGIKALDMYPQLPVVVLTHLKMFEIVQKCINAGFSGYLLKPVAKGDFLAVVGRILTEKNIRKEEQFIENKQMANRIFETDLANPIDTAIKFIEGNYFEAITLKDVSNLVYLSPSHFSRLFKEVTGLNFVEYLMKFRVDQSKLQLKMSMLPIEVIASNNGFSSAAYFSTTFKKIEGLTPSEYRNMFLRLRE